MLADVGGCATASQGNGYCSVIKTANFVFYWS